LVSILLAMLGIVLVACLIVVYVAYPHRGEDVPTAPWVGTAMRKGVDMLPTLDNQNDAVDSADAADDPARREELQR
jgi:hypothetical protein